MLRPMSAAPPSYEEDLASYENNATMEQFEIDEDEVYETLKRDSLLQRTVFVSRRAYFALRERVLAPLARVLDPLREGYSYFHSHYESSILKIGNPLVVKRILYVTFVVVLMSVVLHNENSDGVNGASGGAFLLGKFYDVDKLAATLVLYVSAHSLKDNIEYLSSMPHLAGSTGDLALARYVESYYANNGLQSVDFHELDSFLNYPRPDKTYLALADGSFEASLREGKLDDLHLLAFNPNSPNSNGEIAAPYVYANHADPADLQKLADNNINVKGAILLVRYGGDTPEPNKVVAAHKLGARAVVFISPSIEWAGATHDDVIQKINVGLTRYCPGDVLTPGYSRGRNLDWNTSPATAKIPTIPVSWKDGKHLIEHLGDAGVDFGNGHFSGTASDKKVLKLGVQHEERSTHLIWNVVGGISGREQALKGIIIGAPRDSVCYGASKSASGTAALLELVKMFTSLQRRYDWTPSRSIYFASFDASEYNLAGSAEWVEDRRQELEEEGYAYIDLTALALGDTLSVQAHPLLRDLVLEEMKAVSAKGAKSLYEAFTSKSSITNNMVLDRDFLPFINSLNIPSIYISYKGKLAPSHSCLDTFSNFERELDGNMDKHIQLLELIARIVLRLAEEPMVPLNFNTLGESILGYTKDLERYVDDKINEIKPRVRPQMNFARLHQAIELLDMESKKMEDFKKEWEKFIEGSSSLEPAVLAATRRSANDNMVAFNKEFLVNGEQPIRAGYRNYLFGVPYDAPAHDDDTYEWNTFPMVRDSAARGDFARAQVEIDRVARLLEESSNILTSA